MREMKDSGVAWIGEIPKEWRILQVKHLADVGSGTYISKDEYATNGKFPVIGSNGEIGRTNKTNNSQLVITTGRVGTIGTTHLVKDAWITDNALILTTFGINEKFFYYAIPNLDFGLMSSGTAQPLITATKLKAQIMPYPPLAEQGRIAEVLDAACSKVDALIANQSAQIEKLRAYKQSLITETVTKGLDPEAPMKNSGVEWIGDINCDFQLMRLKDIAFILDEFRKPITADLRNQNADILYDYYGASGVIDKIDGYTIDGHYMLIGEDGANLRMRNLPLMYEVNGKAWINNHAHILSPKDGIDFYYLFYALEGLDINPYITGSAQPKLNQENLKNILVPVPEIEVQRKIVQFIQSKMTVVDALIKVKQQKIDRLGQYKKSLIYEYVTGKKEA